MKVKKGEKMQASIYSDDVQKLKYCQRSLGKEKIKLISSKIFGFLISRRVIFGKFAPFSLIFLTNEHELTLTQFTNFLVSLFAIFSIFDNEMILKYFPVAIFYYLFNFVAHKKNKDISIKLRSVLMFFALVVCSFFMDRFGYVKFTFSAILEAVFVASSMIIRNKIIKTKDVSKTQISKIIGTFFLLLGVIFILKNYQFLEISLGNLISIILMLILSINNKITVCMTIGMLIGFILGFEDFEIFPYVTTFALCSCFSSVLSRYGKFASTLGFLAGYYFIFYYSNNNLVLPITLKELLIALSVFLSLSKSILARVLDYLFCTLGDLEIKEAQKNVQNLKNAIVSKINSISTSFENLSHEFAKPARRLDSREYEDVFEIFDKVANNVCKNCKKCTNCWGAHFNSTYQSMFKILQIYEVKGKVKEDEVPGHFKNECKKLNEVIGEMSQLFLVYKTQYVLKNKTRESGQLILGQLKDVSKLMSNLSEEMSHLPIETSELETKTKRILENIGVRPFLIKIEKNVENQYFVELGLNEMQLRAFTIDKITRSLSMLLERKMVKHEISKGHMAKEYSVKFREVENYEVSYGVASRSKDDISGDSYFITIRNGKLIVLLSDAMGSGKYASEDSRAAVRAFENLIENGFESFLALKMINSLLLANSQSDKFTTIDLCMVDLYSGRIDFIKNGSAPSLFKHYGKIETITSDSPPIGIIPKFDTKNTVKFAGNGDYVIIFSDGIENKGDNKKLKDYITTIGENLGPKALASHILRNAVTDGQNDDMTVIAIKINKKANKFALKEIV